MIIHEIVVHPSPACPVSLAVCTPGDPDRRAHHSILLRCTFDGGEQGRLLDRQVIRVGGDFLTPRSLQRDAGDRAARADCASSASRRASDFTAERPLVLRLMHYTLCLTHARLPACSVHRSRISTPLTAHFGDRQVSKAPRPRQLQQGRFLGRFSGRICLFLLVPQ